MEQEEHKREQVVELDSIVTVENDKLPKGIKLYIKNNFNIEWDIFVKGANENWLRPMSSYNNVFNTVEELYDVLIGLNYKVAYGYFRVTDKKYMRSCFLVRDTEVLDTNRHFYKEVTQMEYVTFVEIPIQDYIRIVIEEDGDLMLIRYLKKLESRWVDFAKTKGIKLLV